MLRLKRVFTTESILRHLEKDVGAAISPSIDVLIFSQLWAAGEDRTWIYDADGEAKL